MNQYAQVQPIQQFLGLVNCVNVNNICQTLTVIKITWGFRQPPTMGYELQLFHAPFTPGNCIDSLFMAMDSDLMVFCAPCWQNGIPFIAYDSITEPRELPVSLGLRSSSP